VVPETGPDSVIVEMFAPEQIVCGVNAFTAGVGLTSTVAVAAVPGQPLAVGVTVKVTVTGALVVFTSDPLMFPEPLAAIPVTEEVLSLVQL